MSAGIVIDSREFDEALRLYTQASRRDLSYILNRAGKNIAIRAIAATPTASKEKIQALIGWRARLIKLARDYNAGRNPREVYKNRAALDRAAQKMVRARARAVGFLRVGWFPAAKAFSAAVKESAIATGGRGGARQQGAPKGSYRLAVESDSPEAMLVNTASGNTQGGGAALERHGNPALQAAVSSVAADMKSFAEKRLAETAARYSAK